MLRGPHGFSGARAMSGVQILATVPLASSDSQPLEEKKTINYKTPYSSCLVGYRWDCATIYEFVESHSSAP